MKKTKALATIFNLFTIVLIAAGIVLAFYWTEVRGQNILSLFDDIPEKIQAGIRGQGGPMFIVGLVIFGVILAQFIFWLIVNIHYGKSHYWAPGLTALLLGTVWFSIDKGKALFNLMGSGARTAIAMVICLFAFFIVILIAIVYNYMAFFQTVKAEKQAAKPAQVVEEKVIEREVVTADTTELEARVSALEDRLDKAEAEVEPKKKGITNFTTPEVRKHVAGLTGEDHPVETVSKDSESENGRGPVSLNVGVCNMQLVYGKGNVTSMLIRLDSDTGRDAMASHNASASNFAGSGDYYKLAVNNGTFYESKELWDLIEASYQYVLSKYFKVENGEYVALEEEEIEEVPEEETVADDTRIKELEDRVATLEALLAKKEEAPVEEKPEPEPEVETEEEGEDRFGNIVRKKLPEKFLEAEKDVLDIYNELRNELESYGVKSRLSASFDSYRAHRVEYAKITLSGKHVKLYLAIEPKRYEGKAAVIDVSDKTKFADVPALFKIKSGLSVKRAKATIAEMMAKAGFTQGEVQTTDYASEIRKEARAAKKRKA